MKRKPSKVRSRSSTRTGGADPWTPTDPPDTVRPLSLWDPVYLGRDLYGDPVYITLAYRNLLLGGLPDARLGYGDARGAIELHFFTHTELVPAHSAAGCYIRVLDVQALHAACSASGLPEVGIPRVTRLEDKPWGLREFAIVDPDGNLLRIGQVIARQPATPRPSTLHQGPT